MAREIIWFGLKKSKEARGLVREGRFYILSLFLFYYR